MTDPMESLAQRVAEQRSFMPGMRGRPGSGSSPAKPTSEQ